MSEGDASRPEIYISTDVETDGPIPGPHSLLSFGSAAFDIDRNLLDTFAVNLATLPEAGGHPDTMAWWARHPAAWAQCRVDPQPPAEAMGAYAAWLKQLPGRPIFVAYPAGFDFTFIHWYLVRFTGANPFGHRALDMRSFAMAHLRRPYSQSGKRHYPAAWFDESAHTHVALDDAIEQGRLFGNMLADNRGAKFPGNSEFPGN